MKLYGIRGQVLWFAFGTWAGAALTALFEIIVRKEFKSGPYFNDGSGIPAELAILVLLACLLTIPYAVWLWASPSYGATRDLASVFLKKAT